VHELVVAVDHINKDKSVKDIRQAEILIDAPAAKRQAEPAASFEDGLGCWTSMGKEARIRTREIVRRCTTHAECVYQVAVDLTSGQKRKQLTTLCLHQLFDVLGVGTFLVVPGQICQTVGRGFGECRQVGLSHLRCAATDG
jgi:hypothetical protein